jgi:hypothetical protein
MTRELIRNDREQALKSRVTLSGARLCFYRFGVLLIYRFVVSTVSCKQ